MVRMFLKAEGLAVFLASLFFYYKLGESWWIFILLVLAPDLSMLGYVLGKRVGAITYDVVHNYALALGIIIFGLLIGNTLISSLGLILAAHIGVDRLVGYGVKYPDDFKKTHMQVV